MAQVYSTGPAHIFVQPVGGSIAYLGTAQFAPVIDIEPAYEPVMNDLGGKRYPLDYGWQGEEAHVVCDLTRLSYTTYVSLAARPQGVTAGLNQNVDLSTFAVQESKSIALWIQFPYQANKSSMNTLVAGYHFPTAIMDAPDNFAAIGTTAMILRLAFHCVRALTIGGTSNYFTLYDNSMSGLPAVS